MGNTWFWLPDHELVQLALSTHSLGGELPVSRLSCCLRAHPTDELPIGWGCGLDSEGTVMQEDSNPR